MRNAQCAMCKHTTQTLHLIIPLPKQACHRTPIHAQPPTTNRPPNLQVCQRLGVQRLQLPLAPRSLLVKLLAEPFQRLPRVGGSV